MNKSDIVNQVVVHKTFGKGTIVSFDERYMEIQFEKLEQIKRFVFPDAFHGFLVFEDFELQMRMKGVISAWKVENEIDKKEHLQSQFTKFEAEQKERRLAAQQRKIEAMQANINRYKEQKEKREKKE